MKCALETRTKEHFRNLKLDNIEKSTIASHFWNTVHEIDNRATSIESVNKMNELLIRKVIYKHAHQIMNFEGPNPSSLITK